MNPSRERTHNDYASGYRWGVGVLDVLKGVARPDEGLHRLQSALALEHRIRVPLYANEKLIGTTFAQRVPNVVQMITGGELTLEVGGGYMSFVGAKAAGKATTSQAIEITPMIQVLMLHDGSGKDGSLVDLAEREGRPGDALLSFVGSGRICAPATPVVAAPEYGITPDLAQHIEKRRQDQEAWMQASDKDWPGTFVLLAGGAGPIASIANLRNAEIGTLASYAPMPPFGVLGFFEGGTENLTLVAPLMIWHHAGGNM